MVKEMKARVQQKIDTSANWAKATNFIPLKGEIIIYSDTNQIKTGDGITKINDLKFTDENKQDKITTSGILQGDGVGNITAADEIQVELVDITPESIGAQPKITTNGLLKGDGNGNITAADSIDLPTKHISNISLLTASWTGSDPYTQTVTISSSTITANTKVDIQPSEEVYDQLVADNVGYLAIKNVNGTLTAVAKGGKPSVDLTVQVTYNNVY